jgi:hypothetical protein
MSLVRKFRIHEFTDENSISLKGKYSGRYSMVDNKTSEDDENNSVRKSALENEEARALS